MSFSELPLKHQFTEAPIPAQDADFKKCLLLLVHGRGGQLKLMNWFTKRFKLPGVDYLQIEAPFAEDLEAMKEPGFSWYLGSKLEGIEESRKKLAEVIKTATEKDYKAERIFWLGFSQGGVMGIDTFLRSRFKLGGVVCVSGFAFCIDDYPEAFGPYALEQSILCTHGERDEIVEIDKAVRSYENLKALGVNLELWRFNKPHSFELKREIPQLEEYLQKKTQ